MLRKTFTPAAVVFTKSLDVWVVVTAVNGPSASVPVALVGIAFLLPVVVDVLDRDAADAHEPEPTSDGLNNPGLVRAWLVRLDREPAALPGIDADHVLFAVDLGDREQPRLRRRRLRLVALALRLLAQPCALTLNTLHVDTCGRES